MRLDKASCGNWWREGWESDQVFVSAADRQILREFAMHLREYAERPSEAEKVRLWTAHNDLERTRPLVFIDPENGWNEILTFDRDIKCTGEMAQDWEMWLRKELFWAESMKDDRVVEAMFYLPYKATDTQWGIEETRIGGEDKTQAYVWEAPIRDFETDLALVQTPRIIVDHETTNRTLALAREVFDGILGVEIRHKWWHAQTITLDYTHLRGLEQMLYDFYDYPDKFHQLMGLIRDGYRAKSQFLEDNGLLCANHNSSYTGSGGFGYTKQLPAPGFDAKHVRQKDMWLFLESQETSTISAEMFGEFILPYQIDMAEPFGLLSYGCCEPIDARWEYVKQLPHLRRVSVSAWASVEKMAEYLGGDYVFSYKPSPSYLAVPDMDEEYLHASIRDMLKKTKDCHVEIIMKDNHTLAHQPRNATRWVEIVREEIERMD